MKKYDTDEAVISICLAIAAGQTPDFRAALAMATDIPADKLELAAHEAASALPELTGLVGMLIAATGSATREALQQCIKETAWTDDGKGEIRTSVSVLDADDNEVASVSATRKL